MKQKRFKFLGKKGWSAILALCLLAVVMAPVAVNAKKLPPVPPGNQTLSQILNGLPNGQPFQLLAQAVLFVEGQVSDLQSAVALLKQQVDSILAQNLETSFSSGGMGVSHSIIDNLAPGSKHVRLEVSFVPASGAPPTDTYIMYALVSPETASSANFISTSSTGIQAPGQAAAFPALLATITGVAELDVVAGTTPGTVGFAVKELSATAGTYFVKVNQ